jgi:hypothetical protein
VVLVKAAVALIERTADTFRRAAPTLACYYAISLGIPLAHEREIRTELLPEHAVFVVLVPLALLSLLGLVRGLLRVARTH